MAEQQPNPQPPEQKPRFAERLAAWREARRVARLKRLEQEFLPPLLELEERPPSPWHGRVLWALFGLLMLGLLWSIFGRVSVDVTASGRLIPVGRVKPVQAVAQSSVAAILVHTGDVVRKGQLLVALDPAVPKEEAGSNAVQLALNLLAARRLTAQLAGDKMLADKSAPVGPKRVETQLYDAQVAAYTAKVKAAVATVRGAQANLDGVRAQLYSLEQIVDMLKRESSNGSVLVREGAISQIKADAVRRQYLAAAAQLAGQRQKVAQAQAAYDGAQAQLDGLNAEYRVTLLKAMESNLEQRSKLVVNRVRVNQRLNRYSLRAPVDGVVQAVDVTSVGQVVSAGQKVVTVVPSGAGIRVEADLPNQDLANVRVGDKASIKVAAFPFEQFGAIPAVIERISPDSSAAGGGVAARANVASPTGGLSYRVRLRLDRDWIEAYGRRQPLQAGMAVQVDVHTGERRIITFFLSPLVKVFKEGLSVR